ncbi:aminoglycoside phosphotransferase (APT) family kinase protein [Streptomyces sp. 1114.5]|uniref:phosphotransferase family protein n=1 Tax=Streptomyces sp. 1114.5 TaxID=1938830 RepID=UPI000EADA0E6|nr:aminoglycoside phosphotransferase family protein [Streptomyces sp. 1114.5]RKT19821.1 aminoglycoside phosphotransferase (APT) family kinase protein [Streptomyces sp. 1114.5]
MELRTVERPAGAFQQSVGAGEIQAVCARVFGLDARVVSAVELDGGMYNNTYRLTVTGQDRPVVLRVAPEPARQFRSERQLMRNEYASLPWLSPIASLMPKVIAADWSHELIGRDWMVQTLLDGAAAFGPRGLIAYPRESWTGFFRRLGAITRQVHAVRGPHFGPVNGPGYARWSQAVAASLADIAADLDGAGLDSADLRKVAAVAAERSEVLDRITEPRLLAGDLWIVNVMLVEDAPEPTVSGVLDLDRTLWGDPAADWTIRMAHAKPGTERDAFWDADGYGAPDGSAEAQWRGRVYEARHLGAIRLEHHRLGDVEGVQGTYEDMAAILGDLTSDPAGDPAGDLSGDLSGGLG